MTRYSLDSRRKLPQPSARAWSDQLPAALALHAHTATCASCHARQTGAARKAPRTGPADPALRGEGRADRTDEMLWLAVVGDGSGVLRWAY